jgi:2',3'-cyclic-nucleotide 2'-phosphodiesterase (5'-nucleotidase family)
MRKFVCSLVITLLCAALANSQAAPSPAGKSEIADNINLRLGQDDGAAFAILIGGNQRGNLELCDCSHPRGGLARRVGYVEAFRQKFKETPVIQVDAGFLFYDATGYPTFAMTMNDLVVRAYSRWPVDVVNLGRFDLSYAQKLFAREGFEERKASLPILGNFVSANGVFGAEASAPPAFVIREIAGPRISARGGKVKVAFVGVAEPIRASRGMMDATVSNMFEAARRAVLAARKQAELVVIVSHAEWAPAKRLAEENPEADVVIAGNVEGYFNPINIGRVLLVPASPGNVKQGDLRVYFDKDRRASFKFRSTDLDEVVPSDPAATSFLEAARLERQRR